MSEVFYVSVVWTAGDIITEAKMDNMVANDRAVDAMRNGIQLVERADPSTPATNNLHIYAKDKAGIPTIYVHDSAGSVYELAELTPTYLFPVKFPFVTTLAAPPIPVIKDAIITEIYVYANTGPVGAALIFDVKKNGSSIWASTPANRITIADGSQTGVQTNFDTVAISKHDIITIDIVQVGATTTGQDISLYVKTK